MTPRPISTAPQEDDRPLLLFCPEQGGWHTGVWFRGKWLAYIDIERCAGAIPLAPGPRRSTRRRMTSPAIAATCEPCRIAPRPQTETLRRAATLSRREPIPR